LLFSVLLHAYEKQFMANRREIRNSTAEFLIFQIEGKEQGIEVYYKDKTIWCTQKAMSMLFNCSTDNIGLHLKNIYDSGELDEKATTEKISVVRQELVSSLFVLLSTDVVPLLPDTWNNAQKILPYISDY